MYHNSNAGIIGNVFVHVAETASTNTLASEIITTNTRPIEGTVVFTDYQSAGIGQLGSEWHAEPQKSITMSVILYPDFLKPPLQHYLVIMTALAVHDFSSKFFSRSRVKVKWPNDIFVDDRKLCGILVQSSMSYSKIKSAVIGIGLNVFPYEDFRVSERQIAFLNEEGKVNQTGFQLMKQLSYYLNKYYEILKEEKYNLLLEKYYEILYKFQEHISYFDCLDYVRREGKIVGIDEHGDLLISGKNNVKPYSLKSIKYPIYD